MASTRKFLEASWRSYWGQDMSRRGPYWMHVLWTVLVSLAFALGFTLFGFIVNARTVADWLDLSTWGHWLARNLVISLSIGFTIHALFELSRALIGRRRFASFGRWQRTLYFAGIPIAGVYLGWPLGYWIFGRDVSGLLHSGNSIAGSVMLSAVVTLALSMYWGLRHRQAAAEARATEAQLKLLQAQIEPHFLFNTLANVVSLIDHDAPRAKQMLESFIDYLRASLTHLRRADSTLGDELDMAQAYLTLLGTRMEERLRYDIDASPAARTAVLPPLLLQPLVENAIHHGLEPKIAGGRVSIRAELHEGQLRVRVSDDGLGLDAPRQPGRRAGTGVGLQNVRERLESRYGDRARLTLEALSPGVLATLELPFETATP